MSPFWLKSLLGRPSRIFFLSQSLCFVMEAFLSTVDETAPGYINLIVAGLNGGRL